MNFAVMKVKKPRVYTMEKVGLLLWATTLIRLVMFYLLIQRFIKFSTFSNMVSKYHGSYTIENFCVIFLASAMTGHSLPLLCQMRCKIQIHITS